MGFQFSTTTQTGFLESKIMHDVSFVIELEGVYRFVFVLGNGVHDALVRVTWFSPFW